MRTLITLFTTLALLGGSAIGVAGQEDEASADDSAPELVSPGPLGKSLADWNLEHLRWAPDADDCSAGDRGEVFFLPRRPLARADCRIGADQHILLAFGAISCSSDDSLVERWRAAKGDGKARKEVERRILEGRARAHTCTFSTRPEVPSREGPGALEADAVIDPTLIVDGVGVPVDERYLSLSTPSVRGRQLMTDAAYVAMLEPLAPGSHVIEYGATYPTHGDGLLPATSVVFAEVVEDSAAGEDASPSPSSLAPAKAVTADWTLIEPQVDLEGDIVLEAVAGLPNGDVVAVGLWEGYEGDAAGKAFAWHESDAEDWVDAKTRGANFPIVDVAAWDDRFVAIGNRQAARASRQGLVWRSTDGRAWDKPVRIKDAQAEDLLATDEGLAVVGASVKNPRRPIPMLWWSTDGKAFEARRLGEPLHWAQHLARSPAGTWIVIGSGCDPDWLCWRGHVLWRSDDGRSWDEIQLPFADERRQIDVVGVGWTPSGFVLAVNGAFLGADASVGSIWHSPDGRAWEMVATSEVSFGAVATSERAQLVFGPRELDEEVPLVIFASSDGLAWHESHDATLEGVRVTAATQLSDGRVLTVGARAGARPGGGVVHRPLALLAPTSGSDGSE